MIPASVAVGPYVYSIQVVYEIEHEDGPDRMMLGDTSKRLQRIRIADWTSQGPDQQRDTVWHETMHAIFEFMQLHHDFDESEERIISALATGTLDVLRRNPELVQYLTG